MTKVTIENSYGAYSVERNSDDMTIYEVATLFRSALLAAGYDPKNVDEILPPQ